MNNIKTCFDAANKNMPELMEQLYKKGFALEFDAGGYIHSVTYDAASHGFLEVLKKAHELGAFWNWTTCAIAAQKGHYECLRYLHENNCPWDSQTCISAAMSGKLKCLKYAVENHCPINTEACRYAAMNGHLDCLDYILSLGIQPDIYIGYELANRGDVTTMQRIHPPIDAWTMNHAVISEKDNFVKYLIDIQCPIDLNHCRNMINVKSKHEITENLKKIKALLSI